MAAGGREALVAHQAVATGDLERFRHDVRHHAGDHARHSRGWLPWGNVSVGTKHLHHYNFGIGVLSGVGLVAVRGDERAIRHPLVAGAYGAGAALIVDEFALLLDLEDVYWAKEGRKSVDAAFGVLAALGTYLTAVPFWHEVVKVAHQHVKHYRRAWVGGRSENRVAE